MPLIAYQQRDLWLTCAKFLKRKGGLNCLPAPGAIPFLTAMAMAADLL